MLSKNFLDTFMESYQDKESQVSKNSLSVNIEVNTEQLDNALEKIRKLANEIERTNKEMEHLCDCVLSNSDKLKDVISKLTLEERLDVLTFLKNNCLSTSVDLENLNKY